MELLQRMRHLMHSVVQSFTAMVLQRAALITMDGMLVSFRFHAFFENIFLAADDALHGTGVRRMLLRQLKHTVDKRRHQEQYFLLWKKICKVRVNSFILAVAEFYQQNTVWPFELFDVAYRVYRMLVGVLLYMRATWVYQKAAMDAQNFRMLLNQYDINFPNEDI